MPLPDELEVPADQQETVDFYRNGLSLPERVTDGMIYARLVANEDAMPGDKELALRNLIRDTRGA